MPDISHLDFSNSLIIIIIAACAFLIIAKVMKVEKAAAGICVCAVIVWLGLHFTVYDKILYNIIFNAVPVESAQPKNLIP